MEQNLFLFFTLLLPFVSSLYIVNNSIPAQYESARLNWNQKLDYYPISIWFCESTADVQYALQYVSTHNISFRVRSGRHSYDQFSQVTAPGIIIDTSQMKRKTLINQNTIAVEPGNVNIEMYAFALENNLLFVGGTCPTVGIGGFLLGGGYSFLSRHFGLAMDQILSMDVVLWNGTQIQVNATNSYQDLYWGLLGAGHNNFGIVTQFTLQLASQSNSFFIVYEMQWSNFDHLESAWNYWQSWSYNTDSKLTSQFVFYQNHFASVGLYYGSHNISQLQLLLQQFIQAAKPDSVQFKLMNYEQVIIYFSNGCTAMQDCLQRAKWTPNQQPPVYWKGKSLFALKEFSNVTVSLVKQFMGVDFQNVTKGFAGVMVDSYGGKIASKSASSTAFYSRQALFHLQFLMYWNDPSEEQPAMEWLNHFYTKIVQSIDPSLFHAYINYADADLESEEYLQIYFGSNAKRLVEVKKKYDPFGKFVYGLGIRQG